MPKPPGPSRADLEVVGSSIRIVWAIPQAEPEITACTVKVRIAGSQRYQNYDHKTGRLVPKGGSTVPAPTCEVTVDGCLEGIEYEAVVAAMNSEGWGDVSQPSEPVSIGEKKPRDKPSPPLIPTLESHSPGKLKCSWSLPDACPPVEASQVRLTDVAKGVSMLVDAAKGLLVESGRTALAAPKTEIVISGVQDGIEYIAAVCCRNAEGFGEYSMPSDPAVSGIDPKAVAGMALVLHSGPSDDVPSLTAMGIGEGKMKVGWVLPEDAKSTMVKLRRVGQKDWKLVGGTAIPAPANETVAPGLEEGIEYEACVSFLRGGRWSKESKLSRPACIGHVKKPDVPGAAKEPWLFTVNDSRLIRCKWRLPTVVPPVSAIFVRVRAVGRHQWFYVHAKTGIPQEEEEGCEPVASSVDQLDISGLHPGVRYEASLILRNKLGMGPPSIPSEAACIGRPIPRLMKCMYCFNDFDMAHAEYSRSAEHFWCPACRFRNLDPFNAIVEPSGMLWCELITRPVTTFTLELPDLKAWRKEDHNVQMRTVRIDSDTCTQVWPLTVTLEANGNEVFKIVPPEEGHVRRDVPRNIAGGVKPGSNTFTVTIDDPHTSSYAMALVHTYPRTVEQISADIAKFPEEQARERVCKLLEDNWNEGITATEEDEDDEIQCVIANKLKLRCPLSFERVVIPVRGDSCMHLQCFGLGAYLASNEKMRALNNRWTCPVCTNVLRPRDLRIDGYVQKVLADTPDHVDEVQIMPGGDCKWIEESELGQAAERARSTKDTVDPAANNEEIEATEATDDKVGKRKIEADAAVGPDGAKRPRRNKLVDVGEEDNGEDEEMADGPAADGPADGPAEGPQPPAS
jgi:hypothetical protein